jgi:hypothetical protein
MKKVLVVAVMVIAAGAITSVVSVLGQSQAQVAAANQGTTTNRSSTIDYACIANAVGARDEALSSAFKKYADDMETALTVRRRTLMADWNNQDGKNAREETWGMYQKKAKTIRAQFVKDQNSAWKQATAALKLCKGGPTAEKEELKNGTN